MFRDSLSSRKGSTVRLVQEESWATNVWTASWDRPWEMNFGRRSILSCGD